MTRVLLIGNGAREHAIASALKKSEVILYAHMSMNNPGIAALAENVTIADITDYRRLPDLTSIDMAVIGPEAPLAKGIVDYLQSQQVPCVGPLQEPARIETSKSFARRLLAKYASDANPMFAEVRSLDAYRDFVKAVGLENIVVKPDGLTGGKGVKIFGEQLVTERDVTKYVSDLFLKDGVVVLEEKLQGTEFTVQAFVDGKHIVTMPLVRDYKRAFDNDEGPNTGSMGSYSRTDHGLEYVTEGDLDTAKTIMQLTIDGIKKTTGREYKGVLYGQFMKTENGIKVVEYNARFGDPEAMNVLSIIESPLEKVFWEIIDGNVSVPAFEQSATVCVYIVPDGYPGRDVVKDAPFSIEPGVISEIYYASVDAREGITYTTGSRTVGVLAKAESVQAARALVYRDIKLVKGTVRYRSDIAQGE